MAHHVHIQNFKIALKRGHFILGNRGQGNAPPPLPSDYAHALDGSGDTGLENCSPGRLDVLM